MVASELAFAYAEEETMTQYPVEGKTGEEVLMYGRGCCHPRRVSQALKWTPVSQRLFRVDSGV